MLLGGQGNVSVTANVAPRLMHELCMAAIEGDVQARHGHPPAAAVAAPAAVLRTQPGAGQVGDVATGPVHATCALPILPLTDRRPGQVGRPARQRCC
jgi:4-hydroxy-tetrahydrodipicolinate synthase